MRVNATRQGVADPRHRPAAGDSRERVRARSSSPSIGYRQPDQRGAGLGLAIARGFTEANGGRLWLESREGRARPSCSPCPSSSCRRGACVTGERILVVDDEPQFLRALQTNLRGAGYAVATATTAQEALTAAGLQPPEAIILDLAPARRPRHRRLPGATRVDAGADHPRSRPSARRRRRSRRSTPAPTTTSRSRSRSASCSRGCGPCCGGRAGRRPGARDRRPCRSTSRSARSPWRDEPGRISLPTSSSCSACSRRTKASCSLTRPSCERSGARLPAGVELHPRLRVAAETQARAGPFAAELHPHRARRRLPPRQSGC